MAKPPKLTEVQKKRLKKLEPQLRKAVDHKNFNLAKTIVSDIQDILRPTGHITKLVKIKNWLFELALELEEYDFAERGFIGNRKLVNKNTKTHLETTALLAICYLRKNELENSKPYISEVLTNKDVIKTERTRKEFNKMIINRFDEEAVLFSLKGKGENLNINEIQNEAATLIRTNNEDELYSKLGKALPESTKQILFLIDDFSKNQLPSAERKLLASTQEIMKDETVGRTVFSSLKRVIYNSLCDPKSDVYKAWFKNGIGAVLDKKYITASIVASLTGVGLGLKALAISAVAIVLRFGLDVYCEHNKPDRIMVRGRRTAH